MKYLIIFLTIFILNACTINGIPEATDWADSWIDSNIHEIYELNNNKSGSKYVQSWRDNKINKDYYLSNGNLVHLTPIREGCLVHWEVDKDTNKIVDYTFEGNRCY